MRVAACQPDYVHCDILRSVEILLRLASDAHAGGADLVCFPECFLQGYLFDDGEAADLALALDSDEFARVLGQMVSLDPTVVFGLIEKKRGCLFNTAVVVRHGMVLGAYRKMHLLPGECVFEAGGEIPVFEVGGVPFGINICNDLNFPDSARAVADRGAVFMLCPCNNMMGRANAERWKHRHNEIRSRRAIETGLWLISSDVTGECGDRVSYGPTAVIAPDGSVVVQARLQSEGIIYHEFEDTLCRPVEPGTCASGSGATSK